MPHRNAGKVDASRFAFVARPDIPRSAFDVRYTHKTTFNAAFLVPVYLDEVLPGDSFRVQMNAFARLATPIVPVMDNLILESFFFFVPNRLLWSNWERFMGEQSSPSDTTEFLVPLYNSTYVLDMQPGMLGDYFGLTDNGSGNTVPVNALPFRAYGLIWNEWFRDEDLQNPVTVAVGDGPDAAGSMTILRRGKRHDYFTSARPWPQKPMNASLFQGSLIGGSTVPGGNMFGAQAGVPVSGLGVQAGDSVQTGGITANTSGRRQEGYSNFFADSTNQLVMKADGTSGYPDVRVLINDIRTANLVQLMLERNSRGGTRYSELLRSHFGVTSPDARLQRPEYLGGGRSFVTVNPVAQTSATGVAGTSTVLGEQAGIGTVLAQRHGFSQSFTEHGYIVGLMCVRPDMSYQQGIHRMWARRTQFDFYWPALANLGEQAIMSREIFAEGNSSDATVFGYNERWSEYKYKPNMITGLFRSNTVGGGLDMWHFAQDFATRPVLNATFIEEQDAPVDRVLQTQTTGGDQFLLDSEFNIRYVRAMPMFSIPGLGPRL